MQAQVGMVKEHQKISDTEGGFTGTLDDFDEFGSSVASLGDLDGDDVGDIAVGTPSDGDELGLNRGTVWVLFLNDDGTVKSHQKISDTEGGFTGTLDNGDHFGSSVASLGNLDGDGVGDIAVGAPSDDDGGDNRGAVWVLFLDGPIIVNTTDDLDDGFCTVAHCSLREAIALISDGGRIIFEPSLDGQTITLSDMHLLIDKNVIIDTEGKNITIE